MKAKINNIEDLASWLNYDGEIVGKRAKTNANSASKNRNSNKLPTPIVVLLRTIVPIAIAATAMILVLSSEGTQKYFFAIVSLIAVAWFVFQFSWLHKRRGLTPGIKP